MFEAVRIDAKSNKQFFHKIGSVWSFFCHPHQLASVDSQITRNSFHFVGTAIRQVFINAA